MASGTGGATAAPSCKPFAAMPAPHSACNLQACVKGEDRARFSGHNRSRALRAPPVQTSRAGSIDAKTQAPGPPRGAHRELAARAARARAACALGARADIGAARIARRLPHVGLRPPPEVRLGHVLAGARRAGGGGGGGRSGRGLVRARPLGAQHDRPRQAGDGLQDAQHLAAHGTRARRHSRAGAQAAVDERAQLADRARR